MLVDEAQSERPDTLAELVGEIDGMDGTHGGADMARWV